MTKIVQLIVIMENGVPSAINIASLEKVLQQTEASQLLSFILPGKRGS